MNEYAMKIILLFIEIAFCGGIFNADYTEIRSP